MIHILIADDDPAMLSFLKQALEKKDYKITAVENGTLAYNALKANANIDLLLTDIIMPGLDGIELSKKAQILHPNLKIMFMSGFTATAIREKYIQNDTDNVMAKPFHLNDLMDQIDEILKN